MYKYNKNDIIKLNNGKNTNFFNIIIKIYNHGGNDMRKSEIAEEISSSIKERKWLSIKYTNKKNENTNYWCSIFDINIELKSFTVDMYNFNEGASVKQGYIYFDQILEARVIDGTTYNVPNGLYKKIEDNIEKLLWLHYDGYNDNILKYLKECYRYDNDPCQDEFNLISGIDVDILKKNNQYLLSPTQVGEISEKILKMEYANSEGKQFQELAINVLSIAFSGKLFVVAYQKVLLDISNKLLRLDKELQFNKSFLIDNNKYSLSRFLDIDANDFCINFSSKRVEYEEYIARNLVNNELLDTKPYLMILKRDMTVNLDKTFQAIANYKHNKKLSIPLNSFFGNVSERNIGKKPLRICFKNNKFNIDQLRVVFSSLMNPVTYVQGPPGTGKTTTIINIILSTFINGKSALICSNNNKPINEIYNKVKFVHNEKPVPFPILRLGNKDENIKSLKNIKRLYNDSKIINIKEKSLDNSKINFTRKFNSLNKIIYAYEKKIAIEERTSVLSDLSSAITDKKLKDTITIELQNLNEQYRNIKNIKDNDVMKFTYIAEEDFHFMQYLYYKSFEYIKKLDDSKYKWLFDIINLPENSEEDKVEKNRQFNNALNDDEKFRQLIEVFPFIVTTNLSANKLGNAEAYFDLCIIDEAGQCNIATSLIPIIRANNLVLIGDQNQLEPVIVIDTNINERLMQKYGITEAYNYCNKSILTVMQEQDKMSQFILLRYHYRCGRKIIQYSNDRFYNGKLNIQTPLKDNELELYDIKTEPNQEKRNSSYQEAVKIVEIIKKNKYKNVGVITPFRNQALLINQLLQQQNIKDVEAGTIHTFQGDEKSVIIFSTAITQATSEKPYKWVSENKEMINVAVTRAKDKLIVVGDYDLINQKANENDNDLTALLKHVKSNGTYKVEPSEKTQYMGLKSYDSKREAQFFETLNHIITTVKDIEVKTKVKVSTVFTKEYVSDKNLYYSGEFDFVIYDRNTKLPVLVVELDGSEHILNQRSVTRDRVKEVIIELKNIKIIRIPNYYIKRYNIIKELLVNNK